MVPAEGRQGRGGEYVSDGGILLEVAEMASDLLDVDTGGMVRGTLSLLREGREGVRAEVLEMGRTWLRALSTTELGKPRLR
eukprot:g13261.t1